MNAKGVAYCLMTAVILAGVARATAQDLQSPDRLLLAPASAFDQGLLGFLNPANAAFVRGPELRLYGWSEAGLRRGLFLGAVPGIGLAVGKMPTPHGPRSVQSIWMGTKVGMLGLGAGYRWQDVPGEPSRNWTGGVIARPAPWVSLGIAGLISSGKDFQQRQAELGLRPFGTERVTLAVSYSVPGNQQWRRGNWFGGVVLRPIPGLHLAFGVEEHAVYRVGLQVQSGPLGFGASRVTGDGGEVYSLRLAQPRRRDLAGSIFPGRELLKIELRGKLDYLRYAWFDRQTHRFLDLIQDLQRAADDPLVGAVALNLSGSALPAELAWEVRAELIRLRSAGKRVVAFLDEGDIIRYWLASCADIVVMDPEGQLQLLGLVTGRTYLKHALEKLGLGFQELRFFKYKSAAETYANDRFSEADREQRSAYLNDVYELLRGEVCAGRGWTTSRFDSLVDLGGIFLAEDAVKVGLVDTVSRWRDIDEILAKKVGKRFRSVARAKVRSRLPDETWGPAERIAVVYALGPCDLDTGIRARYLEKTFDKLAKRSDVKAIVFRVDSPGGLVVPSDMVAQAIRRCRERKPVIVSQGSVAGSGGYWISAWGDSILASPLTITGSIGVIGGWLYDKGLGEKLGLTSDFVKRGEHADLLHGVTLPVLGVTIPHRPLSEEEFAKTRQGILQMYDHFVKLVAQARRLSQDSVRVIGEGRIYSGVDGLAVGLVDRIGTLSDALRLARKMAGIPEGRHVEILEFPRNMGLFPPPMGATAAQANPWRCEPHSWFIRTFATHQLEPMAILPIGLLPLDTSLP